MDSIKYTLDLAGNAKEAVKYTTRIFEGERQTRRQK